MSLFLDLRQKTTTKWHCLLDRDSSLYCSWHKYPHHKHIHFGLFFIALFVSVSLIYSSYKETQAAAPNFVQVNSKDAANQNQNGQAQILDNQGQTIAEAAISQTLIFSGSADQPNKVHIDFSNAPIASLELDDISAIGDGNIHVPVDKMTPGGHWNSKFAIGDITGAAFSKGRFKKIAEGKDLFKCPSWDFANQTCPGRWQKIADITPGLEYTIEFTPGDPGYAESSRKVNALNKKKELLDYVETTPTETAVTLTQDTSAATTTLPVAEITISQIDEANLNNDIIIDVVDITNDSAVKEAIVIDTTNLTAVETKITSLALSNVLLNCISYDEINNACARWKKEKNIAPAAEYDITISSPGKSVFGQSRDGLLVLDKNLEVLPQSSQALDTGKVAVQFVDMNPYKITTYRDTTSTNTTDEIIVDGTNQTTEDSAGKTMSFDLGSSSVNSADIDATAVGYDLFECNDFDDVAQVCKVRYKKIRDLTKDTLYMFNVVKKENTSEFFESKKQITLLDDNDDLFEYTEVIVGADVEIIPTTPGIIKKIKVINHTSNTPNDFKIDEAVSSPREDALQSYAIDPTGLEATSEVEVEAKANTLYKCKNWDFAGNICLGEWVKYKDINPGEIYTLPIDNQDPGFMEVNEQPAPAPSPSVPTQPERSSSGSRGYYKPASVVYNQQPPAASVNAIPTTTAVTTPILVPTTITAVATKNINIASNQNYRATVSPKIEFKRQLKSGSIGIDVKELQTFLNNNGFVLGQTGPGSPGNETSKFGAKTRVALIKFQEAHIDEILKPYNLKKGTGILGPRTRAMLKKLMPQPSAL